MSRWFRHYAGMMRDEKLVAVAIRAKQPVHLVTSCRDCNRMKADKSLDELGWEL